MSDDPKRRPLAIDVVIPTFNGRHLLDRCLACLRTQSVNHKVIVVDDGSSDGTAEHVRSAYPEAIVVEAGANLGFPAACNRGIAVGSGDAIVLLNNDVEVRPDFLEQLVEPLERDSRLASVAALLVRPDGAIDSVGVTVDRTLAGFPRLRGATVSDARRSQPVLTGASGGAGAYRRSAWEAVGGLDEGVVGYGEDVDVALRLRSAGWTATAAPAAVGVHTGSASFGRRSAFQRYHGGFARGYFLRRYGVLFTSVGARALATELIVVMGDAVISRDLRALRGRIAGWRAAAGLPRLQIPPSDAVDAAISFAESLRLRRAVYAS